MPIPDFQSCFMPMLKTLSVRGLMTSRDLATAISDHFGLSEGERRALLPSGNQEVINNRVGWAKTYLKKAGLVESPRKGQVAITAEGRKVLAANPATLEPHLLVQYLEAIAGTPQFEKLFIGGGIKHLTRETFARLEVPLVSEAEQHRIATCLSSLDDLIAAQNDRLSALQTHKQGLLQQLFPSPAEDAV